MCLLLPSPMIPNLEKDCRVGIRNLRFRRRKTRARRKPMETKTRRKIILVGDKVLIAPDKDADRTQHGLYLPPGVKEKEKVQSGYIVNVGPGYAVPNPHFIDQESWSTTPKDPVKYLPLQAEEGDYALFIRDSAIEVEYDGQRYLIVPHSSILMIIRPTNLDGLARE
jgi:chaperonin GroES